MTTQRAPATPLFVHDPFFSIWSAADGLTDGWLSHWTGPPVAMSGLIRVDGRATGSWGPTRGWRHTCLPFHRKAARSCPPARSFGSAGRDRAHPRFRDPGLARRSADHGPAGHLCRHCGDQHRWCSARRADPFRCAGHDLPRSDRSPGRLGVASSCLQLPSAGRRPPRRTGAAIDTHRSHWRSRPIWAGPRRRSGA